MQVDLNKFKQELAKETFGITIEEAWRRNICINCRKPPVFRTEAGREEYKLSAMCEPCFDKMFADNEEKE